MIKKNEIIEIYSGGVYRRNINIRKNQKYITNE